MCDLCNEERYNELNAAGKDFEEICEDCRDDLERDKAYWDKADNIPQNDEGLS